jgi:hypothetical protein
MVNHFRAHQILQRQLATVQKAEKMPSATVSIGLLCPRDVTGFRSFRDCGAWQRAYALRRAVIPLCRRILQAKDFKLHGQIREAARSAPNDEHWNTPPGRRLRQQTG